MATVNVARNDLGVVDRTLVANTADNIIFARAVQEVDVVSDGTAELYVCVTGDDAVVGGPRTTPIPPGAASRTTIGVNNTKVSVIATAAVKYSVTEHQ